MAPSGAPAPSRPRGLSATDAQSRLTATVDYVGLPRARTILQAAPLASEKNVPIVRSVTGDRLAPRLNPRRLTAQHLQRNLAPMYRDSGSLNVESIPLTSPVSAERRRTSKSRGTHRAAGTSKSRTKKVKPKAVSHSESSATEDPIASLNNQIRELVESVGDTISEQQGPVLEQIKSAVETLAALCETLQRGGKRRTADVESTADLETPRSIPALGRKSVAVHEDSRKLIDDISASITNKVLQNIKREFAQVSHPAASLDSEKQEADPDCDWYEEKEKSAFEFRPQSIRSGVYTAANLPRKDSRPDVQTMAATALYRDSVFEGSSSPFSRRPQPLSSAQASRPLYIPPTQYVPRRATPTALHVRTPPLYAREATPTEADNSPGRSSTPNRYPAAAAATRPRSVGPGRRPNTANGPGQRDVIYTLRIDTFQEAAEGKRRSGTSCTHTREVDVVRIHRDPDLFVMPDLLTKTECAHIIDQFEQFVQPSALLPSCLRDVCGAVEVAHLPSEATTALGRIVRRLAAISQRQPKNLDSLTLIRFPPEAVCELKGGQAGAHIIYVFLDEFKEAGGELCFGDVGLKVKPQRGTAMMWRIDSRLAAIERPLFNHSRSVLVAVLS